MESWAREMPVSEYSDAHTASNPVGTGVKQLERDVNLHLG